MKYKVKDQFLSAGPLFTQVNGKTVALVGGPLDVEIPASFNSPASVRKVPAATQEDLKWLFEQGCSQVEKMEAERTVTTDKA